MNINPKPSFIRKPGPKPSAAPDHFPYVHRTIGAIAAKAAQCKGCKSKSHLWKIGTCDVCGGHGRD